MKDLFIVERLESMSDIRESFPNITLADPRSTFEMLIDNFHEVASCGKLHDNAQITGYIIVKRLFELYYKVIAQGSKDADLVQRIFFLLLFHTDHAHFLQSVCLVVLTTTHQIHLSKSTLANFFNDLKIFEISLFTFHYNYKLTLDSFSKNSNILSISSEKKIRATSYPITVQQGKILKISVEQNILNIYNYTPDIMGPYLANPNLQKIGSKAESLKHKIRFARCQMQGWRRNMQDAAISQLDIGNGVSLFGVFDGHGGLEVAKFVEKVFVTQLKAMKQYKQEKYKQALIETFKRVDQMIESKEGEQELKLIRKKYDAASFNDSIISLGTGCTACVVLITPNKIITANAGDSRAVLCRKGRAIPLSFDHKPDNQIQWKRIQGAGGDIINGRINGGLNLSRSLGDFNYKKLKNRPYDEQLITCKPDVNEIARQPGDDEFIILGCDGIWQKFVNDSQPMVTKIDNFRKTNTDSLIILKILLDQFVARQTSEEVGCDNMTSVFIEFL